MQTYCPFELSTLVENIAYQLSQRRWKLGVAESCTGGYLAKTLTDLPGCSDWFEVGLVTYSNRVKQSLLGVYASTLEQYGAVSEQTVHQMARGLLEKTPTQVSIAISGISGPSGGTVQKPVGLVCFAWGLPKMRIYTDTQHFQGNREAVRVQAVKFALLELESYLPKII